MFNNNLKINYYLNELKTKFNINVKLMKTS